MQPRDNASPVAGYSKANRKKKRFSKDTAVSGNTSRHVKRTKVNDFMRVAAPSYSKLGHPDKSTRYTLRQQTKSSSQNERNSLKDLQNMHMEEKSRYISKRVATSSNNLAILNVEKSSGNYYNVLYSMRLDIIAYIMYYKYVLPLSWYITFRFSKNLTTFSYKSTACGF